MLLSNLLLFITLIVAPAALVYALWTRPEPSRFEWLVKLLYTVVFFLYVLVVGRWDWVSIHLRWLWIVLLIAAAVVSYRKAKDALFFADAGPRLTLKRAAGSIFTLAVFLAFFGFSARGYFISAQPVELAFPLKGGQYYVAQGGNSTLVNYHNSHPTQKYALDIVALSPAGLRAAGISPTQLDRYVVYGEPVYAPCAGTVLEAVDGLPDMIPPQTDRDHPAGNHIIIACDSAEVLLAHLSTGSLQVGQGTQVQTGDPLGRIGNSGNTTEPHLHIHAARPAAGGATSGTGIPITFDGRFLVRNGLVGD